MTTEIPLELKQAISDKTDMLMLIVNATYPDIIFPPILLTYEPSGTTAAWAKCLQYQINFDPIMLMDNQEEFLKTIVGHELAHIVTTRVFGDAATDHGKEWGSVMALFGLPAKRCHEFDTSKSRRKTTTYPYRCNCSDGKYIHPMGTRANRMMQKEKRAYNCEVCKSPLIPMSPPVDNPIVPANLIHGTKTEKAKWIFAYYSSLSRAQMLDLFVRGAGLTKRGAATYYSTLTKPVDISEDS